MGGEDGLNTSIGAGLEGRSTTVDTHCSNRETGDGPRRRESPAAIHRVGHNPVGGKGE